MRAAESLRRATTNVELNRDQVDYLSYGRVMDTTRMRTELGFEPKWTTIEALMTSSAVGADSDHRSEMGSLFRKSGRRSDATVGTLSRKGR